jgi:hypothetical protein
LFFFYFSSLFRSLLSQAELVAATDAPRSAVFSSIEERALKKIESKWEMIKGEAWSSLK